MTIEQNLGKRVTLMVVKKVEFGVYLGTDDDKVLLPGKQVPEGIEIGDPIEVFIYKDSQDRLIATTAEPKITLGEVNGSRYRTHRCVLRLGTGEGPAAPIPRADGKAEKGRGVSGRTLCGQVRQALCNYEGI